MKRGILVCILFVAAFSFLSVVWADQLAYNSCETCENTLKKLPAGSILVSYCSLADEDYVEVWKVQKAVVAYTGFKEFYEIMVFYKKLFRSKQPIKEGKYKEPIEYVRVTAKKEDKSDLYDLVGIDFAYVYVPDQKGSYVCLGQSMGLECDVEVEMITLPQEVIEQINSKGQSANKMDAPVKK